MALHDMNESAFVTLYVGRTTRSAHSANNPWRSGLCLAVIVGWLAVSAAACTALSVGVSRGTPLSQFLAQSRASVTQVYRVVAGDQLTARFYYNPQLDEDFQVRPDGNISLSLIGELRAAGKTPSELSAEITNAYA